MALQRREARGSFAYAIAQDVKDAAPRGYVYIHVAWFSCITGRWIGEWSGYVPAPRPMPGLRGEAYLAFLDEWTQHVIGRYVAPHYSNWPTVDQVWNRTAFEACPDDAAVCLDVSRFDWPVGDHIWHRFDYVRRELDWPQSSGHKFLEIDLRTLQVVAQQHSHRPVRDGVIGQKVFDLTGTAFEPLWGSIWGRFVRRGDLWGFEPTEQSMPTGAPLVLPQERKALMEAAIDLSPLIERELIVVR